MKDERRDVMEFEREWIEILNEIRVALPGVQLLFAFLLATPFSDHFRLLSTALQDVYFACFLATTGACALLVAPSVYHRLHWRRDVRDKEEMIRTCNRLAIFGEVLLACAMTAAVYLVSHVVKRGAGAIIITSCAGAAFFSLWFALPLARRSRDRRR